MVCAAVVVVAVVIVVVALSAAATTTATATAAAAAAAAAAVNRAGAVLHTVPLLYVHRCYKGKVTCCSCCWRRQCCLCSPI